MLFTDKNLSRLRMMGFIWSSTNHHLIITNKPMNSKNKVYLFLSVLSFLMVLLSIVKNFDTVELIGLEVPIIWIPLSILLLVLPLLNCVEIIKNNDQPNLFYWIGLLFNILAMIFTLRFFKIPIF